MVDHEGYLSFFQRFRDSDNMLKLKPGQRIFNEIKTDSTQTKSSTLLRLTSGVNGGSGRREWTFVDWDKNGVPNLLLEAEDGHFYYFINNQKSKSK